MTTGPDTAPQTPETDRQRRIDELVEQCMQRSAAGEPILREEILQDHPELMPELGQRLYDTLQRILDAGHADSTLSTDELPVGAEPGVEKVFPGYEITRELHRGGQGVVYQAMQKDTKRKVAIKVLLEGPFASQQSTRRFEREVELVAQLKHPNIIAVYHTGTTTDGTQFYAMDYVRGLTLIQYVRENKLPLEKALQLLVTVCEAVQYAHHKGVIHRDLKPSNIMVDADGSAKILDFGLARMVGGPERTLVSVTGQVVGTLPYLSPEQARGNPDEIDTRTDVYALGVILYEMLTGHYPYPVVGQLDEVLRHITDTQPTPPSRQWQRDSGIGQRSGKLLRPGQCPIDDELQTVALRTLSKERERRYQSAGELARDLRQYLAGEPVEAKRDSSWYVLRKTLGRHKAKAAVATIFVLLAAAFGLFVYGSGQRRAADGFVNEGLRLEERGRRALAYAAYEKALALDDDHFRALCYAALWKKKEYFRQPFSYRKTDLLEEADELCARAMKQSPDNAALWNLKSVVLYSLGDLVAADAAARRCLEIDAQNFYALSNLAKVLALQGRFDEAVQTASKGAKINQQNSERGKYDDGIWRTLGALQLYLSHPQALPSLRRAVEIDGEDSRNHCLLARVYLTLNSAMDAPAALDHAKQAKAVQDLRDPRLGRTLALAYLRNGEFSEAVRHAQAAVEDEQFPSYALLVAAIAEGQLGNHVSARAHLAAAIDQWPEGLADEQVLVTCEKGLLWFDTRAELESLRQEAQGLIPLALSAP